MCHQRLEDLEDQSYGTSGDNCHRYLCESRGCWFMVKRGNSNGNAVEMDKFVADWLHVLRVKYRTPAFDLNLHSASHAFLAQGLSPKYCVPGRTYVRATSSFTSSPMPGLSVRTTWPFWITGWSWIVRSSQPG